MLALTAFQDVSAEFGLTVSIPKTKFMVAGVGVTSVDTAGIPLHGQVVENVSSFVYLGSVITPDVRSAGDVSRCLSLASRAFGSLQDVFANRDLSLHVKRRLYNACVMTVLLYASECRCPLQGDLRRLDSFHHQCIRSILCVSRTQQWEERITNEQLREMWGDPSLLSSRLRKRRLEWLGHVARMSDVRVPKQLLFGFLPSPRHACGPRRRWRDVISPDLRHIGIEHLAWYGIAQDRSAWRVSAVGPSLGGPSHDQSQRVDCLICPRTFRRPGDKARHKCSAERSLPIQEQRGAVQCGTCRRWFHSHGGLRVHHCLPLEPSEASAPASPIPLNVPASLLCVTCNRQFKSVSGFRRHKCDRGHRATKSDRVSYGVRCSRCNRQFRRQSDLSRHLRFCS